MKKFSAKSIMSSVAFLLCAMTANATVITLNNGVMTVNYNAEGQDRLDNVSEANRKATTKLVIIGNHDGNTTTFQNNKDWAIETLDLRQAILPTHYTFKRLYNLQEIVWPTSEFIIPEHAFELADGDIQNGSVPSLAEVTIPGNCKEVQANAFGSQTALKTINIDGPSTVLRYQAFNNVKNVKDVYIKSGEALNPATNECYCEFGAFDYWVTWVQTDMARLDEAACLHFPKDVEENIKWYCNPNVDVLTQKVLNDNYHAACSSSKNGWHEFIVNDNVIVEEEEMFRTFSDNKDHLFKKCTDVNEGVKVYYVVGTINVNGKQKLLIEPLNEKGDYLVPAYSAVLVYTRKAFIVYKSEDRSGAQSVAQYQALTPMKNTNFLEPLHDAPDNYYMSWTSTRRGKQCINMFLSNKKDIDVAPVEWGFYTIIPKTYTTAETTNRGYLNLPTDVMDGDAVYGFNDGNGDVPPSLDANNGAKVFSLDEFDSEDDEVTGLFTVVRENIATSGKYYNLAGQQVSNPTKGLYIHNGKKYMK